MRFWDSSAIVPLLVAEATTAAMQELYREDPVLLVWWGSETECVSALARLEREGALASGDMDVALDRLDAAARGWAGIEPTASVRRIARRLLRVHPLRAADALQLAAAVVAAEGDPAGLEIVTLDDRVRDAAKREGFVALGATAAPSG